MYKDVIEQTVKVFEIILNTKVEDRLTNCTSIY